MKTFYFVRHGESESNAGPAFLYDAPLTARGREQAKFIAKRAAKLPVDAIVSSVMARARETAQEIARETGKPVSYSEILVERRHASVFDGMPKTDPEIVRYDAEFRTLLHDPSWRFQDAENGPDLIARAQRALDYLRSLPEARVLVVGHATFMKVLMAAAIMGEELSGMECMRFLNGFRLTNTGLSILRYDETGTDNPWHVLVWNDHSHLADS